MSDTDSVKVAVYGTLKAGRGNDHLLSSANHRSTERAAGWNMFSVRDWYPVAVPSADNNNEITIEVYDQINEETMFKLDTLEGYPYHYNRKLIQTSVGEAWLYFQDREGFDPLHKIQSGEW